MESKTRTGCDLKTRFSLAEDLLLFEGNWIFKTLVDMWESKIVFEARWVLFGYNMVKSITYKNSYVDMGLETVTVECPEFTFHGPSTHEHAL